jgi:hypothetical protein
MKLRAFDVLLQYGSHIVSIGVVHAEDHTEALDRGRGRLAGAALYVRAKRGAPPIDMSARDRVVSGSMRSMIKGSRRARARYGREP